MRFLFVLIGALLSLFLPNPAGAKLNIVATLPWIGSLAEELGQDRVKITTLVKPTQDPHYVEAKPSMILEVRKADILMLNGLDLEVGYLPVLIESSRNPRVQPGNPGHLDCSQFIEVIDRPTAADRSQGDVHPLGNPHYQLSPKNIRRVAEGITERLARLDPDAADHYRRNFNSFQERFREREKNWRERRVQGKRFLPYHRLFEYLAFEYDFQIIGYIEPKPGIPPSAGYIEKLIERLKKEKPDAILTAPYYGTREVMFLSQKTGVKYIVLPHDVGATEKARNWFLLMDQVLALLE